MPRRGRLSPCAIAKSAFFASSRAFSPVIVIKALTLDSKLSILCKECRVNSTDKISFLSRSSRAFFMVKSCIAILQTQLLPYRGYYKLFQLLKEHLLEITRQRESLREGRELINLFFLEGRKYLL